MIDVRDLRFRYGGAQRDALIDIGWQVEPGEFVLVAGQSGSGKSTLLRCLNGLIPHFHGGYFAGDILIDGRNTRRTPPRDLASSIGTIFQDPESQLVTDSAGDEMAFALENLGFDRRDIARRIDAVCADLGIEHLRNRRVSTMSGGERQMVALAAALAPRPTALVLDEPTSQLDPDNAATIIETLSTQNRLHGLTLLLAEHRLGRLLDASRPLLLVSSGRAQPIAPDCALPILATHGLVPEPDSPGNGPLYGSITHGDQVMSMEGVGFSYGNRPVLNGIDLAIHEGETVALTGPNGSGKTTLLKLLIGLLRPDRGRITVDSRDIAGQPVQQIARSVGYVPQQATLMLHQETARAELDFTLEALGRRGDAQTELETLGLAAYDQTHPLDLSGGERQRLAIAAISVARPRILLLDEPTRGLPWSMKRDLAGFLRSYAAPGRAVLVATHDDDFIRAFAGRRLTLETGRITGDVSASDQVTDDGGQNKDVIPLLTTSNLD